MGGRVCVPGTCVGAPPRPRRSGSLLIPKREVPGARARGLPSSQHNPIRPAFRAPRPASASAPRVCAVLLLPAWRSWFLSRCPCRGQRRCRLGRRWALFDQERRGAGPVRLRGIVVRACASRRLRLRSSPVGRSDPPAGATGAQRERSLPRQLLSPCLFSSSVSPGSRLGSGTRVPPAYCQPPSWSGLGLFPHSGHLPSPGIFSSPLPCSPHSWVDSQALAPECEGRGPSWWQGMQGFLP